MIKVKNTDGDTRKFEILDILKRRLHELQKREALYGAGVEPSVKLEIEDILERIQQLEATLEINLNQGLIDLTSESAQSLNHNKPAQTLDDLMISVSWVILHVAGFLLVKYFSDGSFPKEASIGIIYTTLSILLGFLIVGFSQLKRRKIPVDATGSVVSLVVGCLVSWFLVRQTQNLDNLGSLAGLATTLGTGIIAGAAAGWLAGMSASIIAGIGALLAASLLPWFNANQQLNTLAPIPTTIFFVLIIGTVVWSLVLSSGLIFIFRNFEKIRELYSFK